MEDDHEGKLALCLYDKDYSAPFTMVVTPIPVVAHNETTTKSNESTPLYGLLDGCTAERERREEDGERDALCLDGRAFFFSPTSSTLTFRLSFAFAFPLAQPDYETQDLPSTPDVTRVVCHLAICVIQATGFLGDPLAPDASALAHGPSVIYQSDLAFPFGLSDRRCKTMEIVQEPSRVGIEGCDGARYAGAGVHGGSGGLHPDLSIRDGWDTVVGDAPSPFDHTDTWIIIYGDAFSREGRRSAIK
ncbi:MAG: hypothetical protein DHS80DRAFT_22238 [Piptocephalis tieghemiana]|nr:MAG: hypothetical protein DHS80DRAFT_22238 [Piptocephalis tieghemiana]